METIRQNEDVWLADLRSRPPALAEQRRQVEATLASTQAAEYRLHRVGRWLMNEADAEAFSRQPAPSLDDPVPGHVSREMFENSLERTAAQGRAVERGIRTRF